MAKNKGGRPNKYLTDVLPRFDEILEWLAVGATDREIAENLGINKSTMCEYKKQYSEFNELIIKGRRKPVQAIKAALFRKATGFHYTEKTVVSSEKGVTETTYEKYSLPDPTAGLMLLKHWDNETEWTADPASLKLKKAEFEFKKQHAESEEW